MTRLPPSFLAACGTPRWLALLPLLALAACGVVNPPRPAPLSLPPVPERTAPPLPPPPAAPVAEPEVVTSPVAPAPYSAAVAARFPDPLVVYSTPGLQAGRSGFSSNAEIQAWLRDLALGSIGGNGPTARLLPLGKSQRNEPLQALIVLRGAQTDAASVLAAGKPTVLLLAQQNGDEPAGAEALMVLAKQLVQGPLGAVLERINVILVPRANPDGAATGQSATASGADMARDHLLLNTPEAGALARLVRDYRPMVVVDAHEYSPLAPYLQKFGAIQRFDALVQQASPANQPEFLARAAEEWFRKPLLAALKTNGLSSEWHYTTAADTKDMAVSMGGARSEASRNVNGLKNAVSLLVESRGQGLEKQHIQRRVHTQVVALTSVLRSTVAKANELTQLRSYIDREVSAQACRGEGVVEAATTPAQYDLTMLNPQTGADRTLTVDWNSALALRKLKNRPRPCGYLLPASATVAVERLRLLGVQVFRVAQPGALLGDAYRESTRAPVRRAEPRSTADLNPPIAVEVDLARATLDVPQDSFFVPMAQPAGNLVFAALEPDTPDSFFANRLLGSLQQIQRVMADPAVLRLDPAP